MRSACILIAFVWTASAQAPAPRYATVSGIVLNDATGAPVRRAPVTLSTLDTPPLDALTFTDSNGAFGFNMIPPGTYRLAIEMRGFQHAWFGAATRNRAPGTLALAAGDTRSGITIRLRPLVSISGTVLDADGEPVPGVPVRLLQPSYSRWKPSYLSAGFTVTDDRGRYRIGEMLAGSYVVMAGSPPEGARSIQPQAVPSKSIVAKAYVTQFYPEGARLSAASRIELRPGVDLEGIDFHLVARDTITLHGKVAVPPDAPTPLGHVLVRAVLEDIPEGEQLLVAMLVGQPDYTFELPNLIPGPYAIIVAIAGGDRSYRGVERIELPASGQDLTVRPEPAIDLAGRVDVEGSAPPAGLHVTLVSGDSPAVPGVLRAAVQPDGTFLIHNVVPGLWDIDAAPIPSGGYLKSMRLGDQDVLTEDMRLTSATHDPLRIVISARGAVVAGTVDVPQDNPRAPRARVLLAPAGRYEHVWSFYAEGSSGDDGHFEFKGVAPGRYKLYAFEEMEPNAFEDPNFLKPYARRAEAFDVAEGAHLSRRTELIPHLSRRTEH